MEASYLLRTNALIHGNTVYRMVLTWCSLCLASPTLRSLHCLPITARIQFPCLQSLLLLHPRPTVVE
ncbi:UNVERIFIED_CONTAM: hypothetical protein FKN15_018983 [Acipenser sinensis]